MLSVRIQAIDGKRTLTFLDLRPYRLLQGPPLISRIVTQNRATRLRCSALLMTQSENNLQAQFDIARVGAGTGDAAEEGAGVRRVRLGGRRDLTAGPRRMRK